MVRFRVETPSTVRTIDLPLGEITVGRAAGCAIALDDTSVGRYHGSFRVDSSGRLRFEPSGRGEGTWRNGEPASGSFAVRVGDRVTCGRSHIFVEAVLPGAAAPSPPAPLPAPPPSVPAPLPADTALGPAPAAPGLLDAGLLARLFGRPLTGPAAEGPGPGPAPAPTGAPPAESPVGFRTDLLRVPGSDGEAEARALRRILEINKRLAAETVEEDRLLDRVLEAAVELTGAARAVLLLRAEGGEAEPRRDHGGLGADARAWSAPVRQVLAEGRPLLREGRAGAAPGATRPALCVPMVSPAGVAVGALFVDREGDGGGFDRRAALLLQAFADQAALALHTSRLVRENLERRRALEAAATRQEETNRALEDSLRRRTVELHEARDDAARARRGLDLKHRYDRIIGRSPAMRTVLGLLDRVTESTVPVLVEGESGTGKELVARAIHANGPRAKAAFVVENCAAVPDALIESELFGHERGAFTGADRARDGIFERAHGGTLFLDEVGDMSPEMQKKVLRVLQEGEVRRVGGAEVRKVDVRVVCATNRDLARMVREGRFREDLFYRLCVVRVRIPPLRERREDVALLAAHFLDRIAGEGPGGAPRMEAGALDALTAYGWPGNVRELENEIRRAVTLAEGVINYEILSPHVRGAGAADPGERGTPPPGPAGASIREAVERLERALLLDALAAAAGNKTRAATTLGLSRLGLRKKMARYGIPG